MKKLLLICAGILSLAGCSGSEKIDCYQVSISGINSFTYSQQSLNVNEYVSPEGKSIYSNLNSYSSQVYDPVTDQMIQQEAIIRVYENRYTEEYVDYKFKRTVGLLMQENNYYLDLNNRTLDCEMAFKQAKVDKAQEETANVKEAYSCAKKGYYYLTNYYGSAIAIKKDLTDPSLKRHTYIQYGEDATVSYVKKWFK